MVTKSLLPEAVLTQDDEKKTKTLTFNTFIPVLVKALQDQNREITKNKELLATMRGELNDKSQVIEELKDDMRELKEENEGLRKRLSRLEKLMIR